MNQTKMILKPTLVLVIVLQPRVCLTPEVVTALGIDLTSQLSFAQCIRAIKPSPIIQNWMKMILQRPPVVPTHYLNYKQSWMGVVSRILSEEDNHSIDTWKPNIVEVTITCSDKLNENGIKTMERKKW